MAEVAIDEHTVTCLCNTVLAGICLSALLAFLLWPLLVASSSTSIHTLHPPLHHQISRITTMASSSTSKNTGASATSSSKKTNEKWSYRDYMVVRVLVDEYLDKHQDIEQKHLSAIFAGICPHKKQYPSSRLHEHRSTSKNTSVAKDKQRAWRRNEFSSIEYPGPDYELTVAIKKDIDKSVRDSSASDGEECGILENWDTRAAGKSEDDESEWMNVADGS